MHGFANPARFLRIARWLTPALLVSGLVVTAAALALAAMPARGWRQTSSTRLATAIADHPAMPSQAVGTWMNRIRTVSPCSRSAGASK